MNNKIIKLYLLFICGLLLIGINYNSIAGEVIGHWKFGDASQPGKDSSTAGNNLTVNGTPVVSDGAILLHGGTVSLPTDERDYLYSSSADFELGNESFTVECWIKTSTIDYMKLVGTRTTIRPIYTSQAGWSIGLDKSNSYIIFLVNDADYHCTWARIKIDTSSWDSDEWNYLVGVRDRTNNTVKLYLNNKLVDTQEDTCNDITTSNNFNIGYDSWVGALTKGSLKNIRVSRGVISTEELNTRYNDEIESEVTGPPIVLEYDTRVSDNLTIDVSDGLANQLDLQPTPVSLSYTQEYTNLKEPIYIQLPANPTDQQLIAKKIIIDDFYLRFDINVATLAVGEELSSGTLIKIKESVATEHDESYKLTIEANSNVTQINLSSADNGIIYGAVTLFQIINQATLIERMTISIPSQVTIEDYPKILRRIQVRLLTTDLTDNDDTINTIMMRIARARFNYYTINPQKPTLANIERLVGIAKKYGINIIATSNYADISKDLGRAMTIDDIDPILERFADVADIGCKGFSFHFDDLGSYTSASVDYPGGVGAFQREFLIKMQQVAQEHDISFISVCPTMYMRNWETVQEPTFGDPSNYTNYFEDISHLPDGDIELFHTDLMNIDDLINRGVRKPAYYLNGVWGSKQMFANYTGPSRLTWSWYGFEIDPIIGPKLITDMMVAWQNSFDDGIETVWVGSGSSQGALIAGMWMWNPSDFNETAALKEINRMSGLGAGTFNEFLNFEKNILPLVALFKTYVNQWTAEFDVSVLTRDHILNSDDLVIYWDNYQKAEKAFKTIKAIIAEDNGGYRGGLSTTIVTDMETTLTSFYDKILFKLKRRNMYVLGLNYFKNKITLMGWFNREDGSEADSGFDTFKNYKLTSTSAADSSSAHWTFEVLDNEDVWHSVTTTTAVSNQQWHHVAGSYDGEKLSLYIDGIKVNTVDSIFTIKSIISQKEAYIKYFQGSTSKLELSASTLSAGDITSAFNAGHNYNSALLGAWNLNFGLGEAAFDASGNNNNGIVIGRPAIAIGYRGNALAFDGINDYVSISTTGEKWLEANNQLSLMGWFYREDGAEAVTGIDKVQTYRLTSFKVDNTSAHWTFSIMDSNGSWHSVTTPTAVSNQEWHHVAGTYDGSTLRLYIDGVEVNSIESTFSLRDTTNPVEIGRRDQMRYFKGKIDEVKIMSTGVSTDYILNELDSYVIGHWKLDSNADDVAVDSSGNENNGVINGSSLLSGIRGNALGFDGFSDYVNIDTTGINWHEASNQLSLMAWFYREDGAEGVTGIDKVQTYRLTANRVNSSSANWTFSIVGNDGLWHSVTTPTAVNNQEWHHVAGTYDGSTLRLYIDGVEVNSLESTFSLLDTTNPVEIGRRDQMRYFKGKIDEVKIMSIGANSTYISNEASN